eukprot:COSAG04_NODE_125_length_24621_cov_23.574015_5_plen_290_part_00
MRRARSVTKTLWIEAGRPKTQIARVRGGVTAQPRPLWAGRSQCTPSTIVLGVHCDPSAIRRRWAAGSRRTGEACTRHPARAIPRGHRGCRFRARSAATRQATCATESLAALRRECAREGRKMLAMLESQKREEVVLFVIMNPCGEHALLPGGAGGVSGRARTARTLCGTTQCAAFTGAAARSPPAADCRPPPLVVIHRPSTGATGYTSSSETHGPPMFAAANPRPRQTPTRTSAWTRARSLSAGTLPPAAFTYHVLVTPWIPDPPPPSRGTSMHQRQAEPSGVKAASSR